MLIGVRINLLYFGSLKDLLGCEREAIELGEFARVEDAIRLLRARASNWDSGVWASLAVAVNREYARREALLHDGDEVALLPPVSGGFTG